MGQRAPLLELKEGFLIRFLPNKFHSQASLYSLCSWGRILFVSYQHLLSFRFNHQTGVTDLADVQEVTVQVLVCNVLADVYPTSIQELLDKLSTELSRIVISCLLYQATSDASSYAIHQTSMETFIIVECLGKHSCCRCCWQLLIHCGVI